MSQITVVRQDRTVEAPWGRLGALFLGTAFQCWTLENEVKRIPPGIYPFDFYQSPRWGRLVPLLQNVPNRSSIEIHPANRAEQLEGCLAVGQFHDVHAIWGSQAAFAALMAVLTPGTITVLEPPLGPITVVG